VKRPDLSAADDAALDKPRSNKTLLVGVYGRHTSRAEAEDHLDELERLVETAGGRVVARALQERGTPDPATFVGKGKVKELTEAAQAMGVGWTVFDDELSPSQTRNLEKELPTRVMDRPGVILQIFASRARSREAMTQVELAQLQYALPRLAGGAGANLEQQRGGGAFRGGAGERKIELDRRRIRKRIAVLKADLLRIEKGREVRRRNLRRVPTVSLVGYTNAGKTTLFNALTKSKELAEDRLFATLDPRHARLMGVGGRAIVLTDTIGLVRKLPHSLVASFRSTLTEVNDADVLVHVVDASSPRADEERRVAEEVLAELGVDGKRILLAYNKVDVGDSRQSIVDSRQESRESKVESRKSEETEADALRISARTGLGLDLLRAAVVARLAALGVEVPMYGHAPAPADVGA
jgi:GTP-binding protein HflX